MSVYSFLTNNGQAALNSAMTKGTTVNLTKFKVGTSAAPHSPTDTDLFTPVYTGTFTGKVLNPIDMYLSVVDCVVPYSVGGFTINEVGLYYTEKIAGVATDVLFAIVQYPPTPKAVGTNYPITLIIQTGVNSGDSVAITVPNNQFATINYVDIAKHAGLGDMTRPMTNDNVYITPKWLETFFSSNKSIAASTAASASWSSDLSSSFSPSLIYIEDSSSQTLNSEQTLFRMADWILKFQDPNTGVYEYTAIRRSYTQYVAVNSSVFSIPISNLATGIICMATNTTGSLSTVSLPPSLNFVNGSSSITLQPDETATITRINNTPVVALVGVYSLPSSASITGLSNLMPASMADIDASISAVAWSTLMSAAPDGCIMVVTVPGLQTVNTEDYYLNFGDIIVKDPSGSVMVQKQYFTYYTTSNGATYNLSNYEVSDGIVCSIKNVTASTVSTINLPLGYTFPDGSTSFPLRPSATLTLFKNPGTSIVIYLGEMCDISSTNWPTTQGSFYSLYNVTVDASMAAGSFALTINTLPPSTLMKVSVAGTQLVGGLSYNLKIDDLILKDNQSNFLVIKAAIIWDYLPISADTLLTVSQVPLRTYLTVENTTNSKLKVTLPVGYTFTKNVEYSNSSIFILNSNENLTITLQDAAAKTVTIISHVGTPYSLSAKTVTVGMGYPSNGILVYSSNRIPGKGRLLISTAANTNYISQETGIGRDFQGYGLLGIAAATTAMGYSDNGILLYDQTSAIGTSALLIGDGGLCYSETYLGGLTSDPSLLNVSEVAAGFNGTTVGGTLLCSASATIGFAAFVLGNDGNNFSITL